VLHHTWQVAEADVDEPYALVAEVSQKLLGVGKHLSSWAVSQAWNVAKTGEATVP
jgi:hypothetical protein